MTAEVEAVRRKLGLTAAPLVLDGLKTTCEFFRDVLHEDPMRWWEYLRGIDFHKTVRVELLAPGTPLSRHAAAGGRQKPFAYFTVPGTSPTSTGTTFEDGQFKRFTTDRPTRTLVSIASAISFNNVEKGSFDPTSRMGGGKQFIIAARDTPRPE